MYSVYINGPVNQYNLPGPQTAAPEMIDMESSTTGGGYAPRRIYPHRRYNRSAGRYRLAGAGHRGLVRPGRGRLGRIIAIQALICSILLLIAVLARVLGNSAAGYVSGKIHYVLEHDLELRNIYTYAESLASGIRGGISGDGAAGGESAADEDSNGPDASDVHEGLLAGDMSAVDPQKGDIPGDITCTGNDPAGDPENTATLSAEYSLPDTTDGSPGVPGIYGDGTETGGEEALQYEETAGRVLSTSSGDTGDPAESAAGPGENADSPVLSGPGEHGFPGMAAPAEGKVVTPFGETEGVAGVRKMHTGIDIAVEKASSVKAALDGYVEDTGSYPGYGKFVRIRHSKSLVTVYANCSGILARAGENVKMGDVIAVAGGERIPGGSHIHFEVWLDGAPADPLDYLDMEFR